MDKFLEYYSKKEIQEAILRVCQNREVAPKFGEGFGKRPDILQFPGDILELAQKGATSFHISEERWEDPLRLKPGMSKKELDDNRIGWDLLLDIDTAHWDYAKYTAYFLIEALKYYDVKNISVKFSGKKGFHIAVPFESFPTGEYNKVKIKKFPEWTRVIASFLQEKVKKELTKKILGKESIQKICERTGMKRVEIEVNGELDPFKLVEIDSILITNRHLFRAPYSLHEKTGLVSLPIDPNKILSFEKVQAEPYKIKVNDWFLKVDSNGDARELFVEARNWIGEKNRMEDYKKIVEGKIEDNKGKREFVLSKDMIAEEHFPKCIKKILNGMDDGKKRGLFILLNFFGSVNWKDEDIEKRIKEWNTKNKNPLGTSYIQGQINWAKKQKEKILPPNCSTKAYYADLKIACNDEVCKKFKNPVNCAKWNEKLSKEQKNKKSY